jgi:hypothetical protein
MLRKENFTLNIGLNNNPKNEQQIVESLYHCGINTKDTYLLCRLEIGEYNGETERTLMIKGITSFKLSKFVEIIENLCLVTKQECISTIVSNNKLLIYNETYRGKKQIFNDKYFLKF